MTEAETRISWREALKRAGSFDALRPYLHTGQISARHGGLFSLSDGKAHSGPGDFKPEWWAYAHEDRAGRVIFFLEPVVSGYTVIQEEVFAYAINIELDSVAFNTCFPITDLPPVERKLLAPQAIEVDSAALKQARPRPLATQAEPTASPPATALGKPPPKQSEREDTTAVWVAAEARRMKAAGEIDIRIRITDFAHELERRMGIAAMKKATMKKAAEKKPSLRPVGWRHIKNMLPHWGLWPVSRIK
jgi:hypothetical protein